MARPTNAIKNLTTSFRITTDMDDYISEAADLVGAHKLRKNYEFSSPSDEEERSKT